MTIFKATIKIETDLKQLTREKSHLEMQQIAIEKVIDKFTTAVVQN